MYSSKQVIILLVIALTFNSCNNLGRSKLRIGDIKFPYPEAQAIALSNIREIGGYDTAYYFNKNPDARKHYGQEFLLSRNRKRTYLGDLIESAIYDSFGRRIYYVNKGALGGVMMFSTGSTPDCKYDSLGFLIWMGNEEHNSMHDSFSYFLDSEKNVLRSFHYHESVVDTISYSYDNTGKITAGVRTRKGQHLDSMIYEYNTNGLLAIKQEFFLILDIDFDQAPVEIVSRYHYTHEKLDSMIRKVKCKNPCFNYQDKYYYSPHGLPYKSILQDTMLLNYSYKGRFDSGSLW